MFLEGTTVQVAIKNDLDSVEPNKVNTGYNTNATACWDTFREATHNTYCIRANMYVWKCNITSIWTLGVLSVKSTPKMEGTNS